MRLVLILLICFINFNNCISQPTLIERFDKSSMLFKGSKQEQTKHLLKPVYKYAKLGPPLESLPKLLNSILIGDIPVLEITKIKEYLSEKNIKIEDIGGNINSPLSHNYNGIFANYFVIHDASSPNYKNNAFPKDINSETWKYNNLNNVINSKKVAHIFINRIGESASQNFLSIPWRATKFEKILGEISKGNFLHIELIQPRRSDKNGPRDNDAESPYPGFTTKQLERLALIYIIASARKGNWLVPVYHAALDEGIPCGHDDPQNFDLEKWSEILNKTINDINLKELGVVNTFLPSTVLDSLKGLPIINCEDSNLVIKHKFKSWERIITLPFTGKFVEEAHYVTTNDKFPQQRLFPNSKNERIQKHLLNSLLIYQKFDPNISFSELYRQSYQKEWTPEEGGHFGQGSVGNLQANELQATDELWMMNMMWALGHKPPRGTKFLVKANNKNVVVIAGYETGPQDKKYLGGLTVEVHRWLQTNNNSEIEIVLLKDQKVSSGPCLCN